MQPGRLVGHLLNEIGVSDDGQGRHAGLIETVLRKHAEEGIITLECSGKVVNGYRLKTSPKRVSVPSHLKASVSTPPPTEELEVTPREEEEAVADSQLSRAEMVTLALRCLQEEADEDGQVFISSAAQLISDKLEISYDAARELNKVLHLLQLRTSPSGRNPGGRRPHKVSMEIKEVTEEMIKAARQSTDSEPEAASESVAAETAEEIDDDAATKLATIITSLEAELVAERAAREEAEKLTRVVQELEAKIATLEGTIEDQNRAMAEGTRVLNTLTTESEELKTKLATAEEELNTHRKQALVKRAPSPQVAQILERYKV